MGAAVLVDVPQVVDHTTARSANGEAIAAWLRELGYIAPVPYQPPGIEGFTRALPHKWTRALYGWTHEGRCIGFYKLDELLTALGLHVSEVPDHAWRPGPANHR